MMKALGFSGAVALIMVMPAMAQTSQIQACQAIADAQARLACYDRVSRGGAASPGPATSAPVPYVPPAPYQRPAPATQDYAGQFGEEDMGVERPSHRLRYIISEVADYKLDMRGKFTVTLTNGQTWKQMNGETSPAPRNVAKRVKIERGFLGSYDLTFNGMRPSFKVERIR